LKLAAQAKRRPHYLYGSKEMKDKRAPICLPPLQNSYFEDYHPLKGSLSVATDSDKISELVDQLKGYMKAVESGYAGSKEKGKLHGYGKHVFPRYDIYCVLCSLSGGTTRTTWSCIIFLITISIIK
jgi:hypothetical protein